ncbi:ferrous iron transport protein B [Trichlorobacter ammonificans]|uniref:Ferrous iron transport protein B n=1 Tax=Trichlorobacter ammonificans TaxID=2916410 RepID=A0ABN8HD34_9BACT|nr:ferrous iron transport protein B [Trichlorobacter ammonificans]CAH2030640.1 Fe(2+) transport protein A/Fe(2+) transporter FeoB fusion protein [Trichlorobacter ammonificans]
MKRENAYVVAVAGNPNAGKSTLINAIAGSRLHVGNWPGVTVEKKEALFEFAGRPIRLVDLPGCYSLSPYTQEEIITRDYLVQHKPDLIINVVDATNLERNLYLTIQLLELGIPMIMALNIHDEAEAKGYRINAAQMAETLGITVVPTSATRKTGLDDLLKAVVATAESTAAHRPRTLSYGEDVESALTCLHDHLQRQHGALLDQYPQRWLLLKLLEGDKLVLEGVNISPASLPPQAFEHLNRAHGNDIEGVMADSRYALSAGLCREVLTKPEKRSIELTERIDRIVLNRFLGIPIFMAAMWFLFKLTFDLSSPFSDWLDAMTNGPFKRWTAAILGGIGAPDWTVSLVNDGVIAGVGSVLVFVPVIFAMMFFITFLEGSGYMARAAFVMDRAMHAIGLHGKSFIPMLLGFGCNVPGIYATRTLENPKDKILTALLIPLMSCGARLPVYVLFVGVFFPDNPGTVIWVLYIMGILLAVLMGFIFKRTLFRGEAPMFIMELPPYRMPSFASLCLHTWEKGKHFLIKAGTYIFAVSVLVWFLLNLPWGVESKRDSYLGKAGSAVAPIFEPVGFGTWEAASSLITGVIAKEIVVGTMGEIYAPKEEEKKEAAPPLGEDVKEIVVSFGGAVKAAVSALLYLPEAEEPEEDLSSLKQALKGQFTPLTSFAFMAFVLLYMPCVVVGAAMRHEFGTWKWMGVAFTYSTILAWTVALLIYQGGKLLGLGG